MVPNVSWREKRLQHPEDEVLISLYLPWNLYSHGDVIPKRRKWLLENFAKVLTIFEEASIPVHMSYQRVDLDALTVLGGFDLDRLQKLPLLSAPFGHPLLGLLEGIGEDHAHLRFQIENGVKGNLKASLDGEEYELYFCPEFDVPSHVKKVFGRDRFIFPNVGKFATSYSHCQVGAVEDDVIIDSYDAIRYQGNLVVPMKAADSGGDKFMGAWFSYQKDDSDENLQKVVDSIRAIVGNEKNRGKGVVLFVDGESMLVGGNPLFETEYPLHGYELWEKFFQALKAEGLNRYFGDMEEQAERWHKAAVELPAGRLITRFYQKWNNEPQQTKVTTSYGTVLPNGTRKIANQFVGSHISVSDNLSVYTTANKPPEKRYQFVGRGQTWPLGYDHVTTVLGGVAWKILAGRGGNFKSQIKRVMEDDRRYFNDGKSLGEAERWQLNLACQIYDHYDNLNA